MAMKNWYSVKKESDVVSWTNEDVYPHNNITLRKNEDGWIAIYGKLGNAKRKQFKTKDRAISFAKSYMRSH